MVPIEDADWDTAKLFSQRIAVAMAADSPRLYLAKVTRRCATAASSSIISAIRAKRPLSRRIDARAARRASIGAVDLGAAVADQRRQRFSVRDLKKRIKNDAWAEIGKVRQKLPAPGKGPALKVPERAIKGGPDRNHPEG